MQRYTKKSRGLGSNERRLLSVAGAAAACGTQWNRERTSRALTRFSGLGRIAPQRREPGLLIPRQARWAIVVANFLEARAQHKFSPLLEVVVDTIPLPTPTFVIIPSRVRCEEHSSWTQTAPQFLEDASEFAARHVEQRRVGEYAIEICARKIQSQEILVEDLNLCLAARHLDEGERAIESHRMMTELAKRDQIAPRSAAKIENAVGARTLQFPN